MSWSINDDGWKVALDRYLTEPPEYDEPDDDEPDEYDDYWEKEE